MRRLTMIVAVSTLGGLTACASTPPRPEILSVRDPYAFCRVIALRGCALSATSAFTDTGDADVHAILGLEP